MVGWNQAADRFDLRADHRARATQVVMARSLPLIETLPRVGRGHDLTGYDTR
jgi:hypothetical protein